MANAEDVVPPPPGLLPPMTVTVQGTESQLARFTAVVPGAVGDEIQRYIEELRTYAGELPMSIQSQTRTRAYSWETNYPHS